MIGVENKCNNQPYRTCYGQRQHILRQRSGYAEITNSDDIAFVKAPGYGRAGALGM